MTTAVLKQLGQFSPQDFSKISKPRRVNSSRLEQFTGFLDQLAILVEQQWDNLSNDEQTLLTTMVYDALNESGEVQGWLKRLTQRLSFAWMLLNSGEDAFVQYRNAVYRLINAVLDKIERSHPDYDRKLSETLQETLADSENYSAMTQDEFGEWLTSL
ncbi:hypothetical protein PN462_00665 [Spirulina sp. CS-785/01]|uniref:hypothetical protein n=1 Tax=Spirulina sp. CS-785/01 TaxID=3021716 RepID=UPI00232DC85A|nr:hypothetical protein [Spirulina sp. CS-785/01]MDB9311593.1 hypothetical protein [Spirulina sp. CS-785/01]